MGAVSDVALALQQITRRFGGQAAVDDLTLAVRRGELLALVGASGSGKTTTLRIVAGYERPDSGSVILDNADITELPPERRGFGMVFQHYALFPHLSVLENVAFGLEARGISRAERAQRALATLDSVGMRELSARPVQALSGGEQQRVALARALVIEPPVLLLDEPLSNLDPTLRRSTRDELRSLLHRLGVTALFVTHDQEDAFAVADRVAVLERGRLLQVGTPEALYRAPANRAVAEFIGHATLLPASVKGAEVAMTVGETTLRAPLVGAGAGAGASDQPAGTGDSFAVLRPELLRITDDEASTWPGSVESRRFVGSTFIYRIKLVNGGTVEATSPARLEESAAVRVRLSGDPVAIVQ